MAGEIDEAGFILFHEQPIQTRSYSCGSNQSWKREAQMAEVVRIVEFPLCFYTEVPSRIRVDVLELRPVSQSPPC